MDGWMDGLAIGCCGDIHASSLVKDVENVEE